MLSEVCGENLYINKRYWNRWHLERPCMWRKLCNGCPPPPASPRGRAGFAQSQQCGAGDGWLVGWVNVVFSVWGGVERDPILSGITHRSSKRALQVMCREGCAQGGVSLWSPRSFLVASRGVEGKCLRAVAMLGARGQCGGAELGCPTAQCGVGAGSVRPLMLGGRHAGRPAGRRHVLRRLAL